MRGNPLKYNDPSGHCIPICIIAALLGAALIVQGDTTNTTYVPTQADIASSQLGGVLILGGLSGVSTYGLSAATKAIVMGASANATASATVQVIKNQKVNPIETGIAATYGAVGGWGASLPGYWGYVVSGFAGGAQQVTTDYVVNQQNLADTVNINTAIATALGVAGTIAQGAMPSVIKYPTSIGEFNVETLPMDYAPIFTGKMARQLASEQSSYAVGIRYISGFFISSLPVSVAQNVQFADPIRGPR